MANLASDALAFNNHLNVLNNHLSSQLLAAADTMQYLQQQQPTLHASTHRHQAAQPVVAQHQQPSQPHHSMAAAAAFTGNGSLLSQHLHAQQQRVNAGAAAAAASFVAGATGTESFQPSLYITSPPGQPFSLRLDNVLPVVGPRHLQLIAQQGSASTQFVPMSMFEPGGHSLLTNSHQQLLVPPGWQMQSTLDTAQQQQQRQQQQHQAAHRQLVADAVSRRDAAVWPTAAHSSLLLDQLPSAAAAAAALRALPLDSHESLYTQLIEREMRHGHGLVQQQQHKRQVAAAAAAAHSGLMAANQQDLTGDGGAYSTGGQWYGSGISGRRNLAMSSPPRKRVKNERPPPEQQLLSEHHQYVGRGRMAAAAIGTSGSRIKPEATLSSARHARHSDELVSHSSTPCSVIVISDTEDEKDTVVHVAGVPVPPLLNVDSRASRCCSSGSVIITDVAAHHVRAHDGRGGGRSRHQLDIIIDSKSNLSPIKHEPKPVIEPSPMGGQMTGNAAAGLPPRKWKHRHIDRHFSTTAASAAAGALLDHRQHDYNSIESVCHSGDGVATGDYFQNSWLVAEQPVLLSDVRGIQGGLPVVKKGSSPPCPTMVVPRDLSKRYRLVDCSADGGIPVVARGNLGLDGDRNAMMAVRKRRLDDPTVSVMGSGTMRNRHHGDQTVQFAPSPNPSAKFSSITYGIGLPDLDPRKTLYHSTPEMMQIARQRSAVLEMAMVSSSTVCSNSLDLCTSPLVVGTQPPPAHQSPRHTTHVTYPLPAHFHPLPSFSPQ
jgi:hypothetical protein